MRIASKNLKKLLIGEKNAGYYKHMNRKSLLIAAAGTLLAFGVAVPASGTPIARYTFAGNANDTSGNGFNLATTGSVVFGSATVNSVNLNTATVSNNSDGNVAAVSYLSRTAGFAGLTLDTHSLALWANGTAMSNSFNDIASASNGAAIGYELQTNNGSFVNDRVTLFGTSGLPTSNTSSIGSEGVWNHYAVTSAAGVLRYYVNGSLVGTGAGGGPSGTLSDLWLFRGSTFNSPTARGWNGSIADVQVYGFTLTNADVASLAATPGSAIPEPSSALLLAAAPVAGLLARRRRV